MSRFLSSLQAELVDDSQDWWRLKSPLVYQSTLAKQIITVPAGFETDFASVPRLPLAFWLTGNTARAAAAVHDYLYSTGQFKRAMADKVMLEAMAATAVPAWRRHSMYWMVRLFGGAHYTPAPANRQESPQSPTIPAAPDP